MPENKLSNKELIESALPFQSLTQKQWNEIMKFIRLIELTEGKDSVLYVAMQILKSNQLRIDVMNNDN